jgi:hypothetical protein
VEFLDKPELIKVAQRVREDLLIKNWFHYKNTCFNDRLQQVYILKINNQRRGFKCLKLNEQFIEQKKEFMI